MSLEVFVERVLARECLVAEGATERTFARVTSHVHLQVVFAGERGRAQGAVEGTFATAAMLAHDRNASAAKSATTGPVLRRVASGVTPHTSQNLR